MAYLLDANVFIEAKHTYYGFDFAPAFWDWIDQENPAGRVLSIESVGNELRAGQDQLSQWAAARVSSLFVSPDPSILPSLQAVSAWATSAGFEPAAVSTFLQTADYYLVAHARAHGDIVVTREVVSLSTKRIKIPVACIALGITCMSPFEMLSIEQARFVLAS